MRRILELMGYTLLTCILVIAIVVDALWELIKLVLVILFGIACLHLIGWL